MSSEKGNPDVAIVNFVDRPHTSWVFNHTSRVGRGSDLLYAAVA